MPGPDDAPLTKTLTTVRVDPPTHAAVRAAAQGEGCSQGEIVRNALSLFFRGPGRRYAPSPPRTEK